MRRQKRPDIGSIVGNLSSAEIVNMLSEIGQFIRAEVETRTTRDRFAYENQISSSAMTRYYTGGDMNLSTFLRILHGLQLTPDKFFKKIRQSSSGASFLSGPLE